MPASYAPSTYAFPYSALTVPSAAGGLPPPQPLQLAGGQLSGGHHAVAPPGHLSAKAKAAHALSELGGGGGSVGGGVSLVVGGGSGGGIGGAGGSSGGPGGGGVGGGGGSGGGGHNPIGSAAAAALAVAAAQAAAAASEPKPLLSSKYEALSDED